MKRTLSTLLAVVLCTVAFQVDAGTCFLQQSTGSQNLTLPTFVDSTDGATAKTGLTIANTDIKLTKGFAATTQTNKNTGGATHIATGDYYITLDATDTNTVGPLKIKVAVSGALPVWVDCMVLPTANYAALFSTAPGASGGLLIAGTNADFDVTANASFAGGVTITQSSSNAAALVVTGNGTGNGATFTSGSGATGNGASFVAASTNGSAIGVTPTGSGSVFSTSPSVTLADTTSQCIKALGCSAQGTLSGTHSSTTADLGTNAPGATSDMTGKTLYIPAKFFSRAISSYDTSTGVATWEGATGLTLANGDQWYLADTAPGSAGAGDVTTIEGTDATDVIDARIAAANILRPTTAGRTLDVTATGEAGIDWANIGSPTTSVNLSGTTVGTATALTNLPTIPTNWITAAGIAADAIGDSELNVTGSEFTAIPWNAAWDTEVQSEANDAIVANHLNYLFATTYDPASPPGQTDAWANELVESDAGVTRFTVNALENGPSGSGASAEAIADEVETRTIAGVTTVGTVTDGAKAAELAKVPKSDGTVTWNATALASILTQVSSALATYDGPTDTEMDAALAALDTLIDGIKAKTDQLTFGVTGKVDSNVTHMNEAEVTGLGTEAEPWTGVE